MQNKVIRQLQEIANTFQMKLDIESEASDDSLVEYKIQKGDVAFYITAPKIGGDYYAYDLSSNYLPRELYSDKLREHFSKVQRSNEILKTINNLMAQNIIFYSKPGIFNKEKGFIILPIDGKEISINLRRNYFELPIEKGTSKDASS